MLGYNQGMARHTFLNDVIFKIVFGAEGESGPGAGIDQRPS